MKGEKFNTPVHKPRILVAPLDWGLGHATRCIPVIFKLIEQNCEVIIAAEGAGKILLQSEFPNLHFIELKGYRVQYSRNKFLMPVKLVLQFPKLIYKICAEKRWLKKIIEVYKIDAVISDNRLGLSHKKIPSVYITHQLQMKTGNHFTERIAQKIHYHFINKYTVCWVPDAGGNFNLAGELSHPSVLPQVQVKYIGALSRFEKTGLDFKYDLAVILSGPEPQRTIFEKLILKDLKEFKGNVFLLRGLPGKTLVNDLNKPAFEIQNHLPAAELNKVLLQSKIILSRCGYTTVMDLVKLQKKAILIPTPGQTEQEYLADYLQKKHLFLCVEQKDFSLPEVLNKALGFHDTELPVSFNDYEVIVEEFIRDLNNN